MPVPNVMQVPAAKVRRSDMIMLDDEGNNVEDGQPREWREPPERTATGSKVWLKTKDTFGPRGKFTFTFRGYSPVWVLRAMPTEEENTQALIERIQHYRQHSASSLKEIENRFLEKALAHGVAVAMNSSVANLVKETYTTERIWKFYDNRLKEENQTPITALRATLEAIRKALLGRSSFGTFYEFRSEDRLLQVERMQMFLDRYEGHVE